MPATLVSFHAHPDDESIATGGVIAKAAAEGHRVVLVVATGGEVGEVKEGVLAAGESLADRRRIETQRAAEILGIARVEFLGYRDSGMAGTTDNDAPGSFWTADVDEAAHRLAAILEEEHAEVLTIYDENGGYEHPDHIQVHRVGVRAAELARTARVYESVMNRDHITRLLAARRPELEAIGQWPPPGIDESGEVAIGVPEALITTAVDVGELVDTKRAALAAHASQVDETSFFLAMPPEAFRESFGVEWFVHRGIPSGLTESSIF
jgi:LmbE family N-acetylglucosaminyl deacetylase